MDRGTRMVEVLIMGKDNRLKPEVNGKWCKRCGVCVTFCKQEVFEQDRLGRPVIAQPEGCNGCRACLLRCPDMAIDLVER